MTSSEPIPVGVATRQRIMAAMQIEVKRAATGAVDVYWQVPMPRSPRQARIVLGWMRRQFVTIPKGRKVYLEVRPWRGKSRWVLFAIGGAA